MNQHNFPAEYLHKGWAIIPIPLHHKKPVLEGWQNLRIKEIDLPKFFNGESNIGVLLGEPSSGLIDVDLDCQEAVLGAPFFLPETSCKFGRHSKRKSHWLYVCDPILETKKFQTKEDKMIVELRSTGTQTVFPDSVHPSGENINWDENNVPAKVTPQVLLKQVTKLAAVALLARHWPEKGSRQDAALALSGGLLRAGWDEQEAVTVVQGVVTGAQDDEPQKRIDCVNFTTRKIANGQPVTGWNTISSLIGRDVISKVLEWLGINCTLFEWPEPEEIPSEQLLSVENLPDAIIPEPFRPWLADIANRMQCPIDFLAASSVVLTGAVVGAGCGIRPKQYDDWLVIPNIWGGIVARPSQLKTPALSEILKPLSRLETKAKEHYDNKIREYELDTEVYKAQRDSFKYEMTSSARRKNSNARTIEAIRQSLGQLEEPRAPSRRRFKTNDATVEKMSELLNENFRGILLFRDELVGLLASWDKEGRETDRSFYLEAWNGYGSFTTDRIGRGTIDTKNLCVSILGGIQPSKLLAYLYQSLSDLQNDGLMQRMQLLVYPDEPPGWKLVDENPDKEARNRVYEVISKLASMDFAKYGAKSDDNAEIPYFRFSKEAQTIFNEWLTELQTIKLKCETDLPIILEHLSKYRSLMPTLALIFHLIDIADGKVRVGPIPTEAVVMAAAWCDYLESHARRIYGLVSDVTVRAAIELAKKIKNGLVRDSFSLRDVYRKGWHLLDKKEIVQEACNELVGAGWLSEEIVQNTRKLYMINPKFLP